MALSVIHLLNWFYSFSLNMLSLICFCNWKKRKTCLKNTGQWNPTPNSINLFDPQPDWTDPTRPTCFVMSTKYNWFICLIKANKHYIWIVTWIVKAKVYIEPCHEDYEHHTWVVKSEEYDDKYYSGKINE